MSQGFTGGTGKLQFRGDLVNPDDIVWVSVRRTMVDDAALCFMIQALDVFQKHTPPPLPKRCPRCRHK
jgi:hypothetical protein